jgi:phasin family protein
MIMQNKKSFSNPFENWGDNMKQAWDWGRVREQANRNMQAMASANQVAVEGMQAISRRAAETMQKNAQNGMECFRDACSSRSVEDAQRLQASFWSDFMQSCCSNAREATEVASRATMEIVDICNRSVSDNVGEWTKASRAGDNSKK